jgi:hypothetical protein
VLLLAGGLLYTLGGVAYATHRPDPKPGSFGYHEVFHLLTVIAATCQYAAVFLAISHRPLMSPGPPRGAVRKDRSHASTLTPAGLTRPAVASAAQEITCTIQINGEPTP